MKRIKILNAESQQYSRAALAILEEFAEVELAELDRRGLIERVPDADVLIVRLGHRIDAEILALAPRLKIVATATTGLNHIDLEEAARWGIEVVSLRGETSFLDGVSATAEHAWALLLAIARRLPAAAESVAKRKEWRRDAYRGIELKGKTLGIIGLGRLGRKVAVYALAFDMRVLAYDTSLGQVPAGVEPADIEKLLEQSDFVSLHVSYSEENRGIFGRKEFGLMKTGAYFINTSRGEIVDEQALLEALVNGQLGGAALDVLQCENTAADKGSAAGNDPLVAYSETGRNLIITPHIGGCTTESMEKTEVFIATKIRSHFI